MGNDFDLVLKDAYFKYQSKQQKHGNSWKYMELDALRGRLREEFHEWKMSKQGKEEYYELIDIINIASMLATRIKEKRSLEGYSLDK